MNEPRRKLPPSPITRRDWPSARTPSATKVVSRSAYAEVLAFARRAGIAAICTIAPLGVLAGAVSACGAAMPVQPQPPQNGAEPGAVTAPPTGAGTTPAPLTSIAPPSAPPPAP